MEWRIWPFFVYEVKSHTSKKLKDFRMGSWITSEAETMSSMTFRMRMTDMAWKSDKRVSKKTYRFHKRGSTIAGAGWTKEMLGATHGWESRCLETIGARVWKGLSRFS